MAASRRMRLPGFQNVSCHCSMDPQYSQAACFVIAANATLQLPHVLYHRPGRRRGSGQHRVLSEVILLARLLLNTSKRLGLFCSLIGSCFRFSLKLCGYDIHTLPRFNRMALRRIGMVVMLSNGILLIAQQFVLSLPSGRQYSCRQRPDQAAAKICFQCVHRHLR